MFEVPGLDSSSTKNVDNEIKSQFRISSQTAGPISQVELLETLVASSTGNRTSLWLTDDVTSKTFCHLFPNAAFSSSLK